MSILYVYISYYICTTFKVYRNIYLSKQIFIGTPGTWVWKCTMQFWKKLAYINHAKIIALYHLIFSIYQQSSSMFICLRGRGVTCWMVMLDVVTKNLVWTLHKNSQQKSNKGKTHHRPWLVWHHLMLFVQEEGDMENNVFSYKIIAANYKMIQTHVLCHNCVMFNYDHCNLYT